MSVTTATQRLTAAHHETRRHNNKKARETGKTQLTGYLSQVVAGAGSEPA